MAMVDIFMSQTFLAQFDPVIVKSLESKLTGSWMPAMRSTSSSFDMNIHLFKEELSIVGALWVNQTFPDANDNVIKVFFCDFDSLLIDELSWRPKLWWGGTVRLKHLLPKINEDSGKSRESFHGWKPFSFSGLTREPESEFWFLAWKFLFDQANVRSHSAAQFLGGS